MKILITGGAGFIGSHLADRLLAAGEQVLVIDNFSTGRRDNLAPHPALSLIEGSIADSALVERAFASFSPDLVVHAAASYKDPQDWAGDIQTNVHGSSLIFQACRRHNVRRTIYFQTALCYGLHPLEQPISLTHPLRPDGSSYAISKTTAEHYLRLSGIPAVTFRLANVYGPRNLSGPLPTFFSRITSGKKCFVMDTRRDFVFIDDLVRVVLGSIAGQGGMGAYHISTGKDHHIRELYEAVLAALGIRETAAVEVRQPGPDDAPTILLDPARTEQDFAWQARTALPDGVAAAIAYYRTHGITETYTHLAIKDGR